MNVADRPGMYFLDTNIFVYSFDSTAPGKQNIATDLIQDALKSQRGVISSQVVQEFLNVALWKFARPMNASDALPISECRADAIVPALSIDGVLRSCFAGERGNWFLFL